ncbi:MAG TPA: helicase-related protein [Aquabacterium sp.]|nr:helicase-related protein [Aquabacterium sp.]
MRQRGRHSLLQARFHRPQDALYLALRQSCLHEPALAAWTLKRLPSLLSDANALLAAQVVSPAAADRVDHALASRCIRQAALHMWKQHHPQSTALGDISEIEPADDAASQIGDGPKRTVPTWRITAPLARLVVGSGRSLWGWHAAMLSQFPSKLRERLVERLARYLTSKQVPFLVDLLVHASASGIKVDPVESLGLLRAMPGFWRTRVGQDWVGRLGDFLAWVLNQTTEHRELILADLDKTRSGGFVRHTLDTDSRERLRQLFNTPLFPMVLVANAVMQEGLDLHRQCRRVVHHDLEWNPAQVEQRIGRVDRLGSLTSRLREADPTQKLHILYPAICSTIDERLYRTVKMREKWLEFLLGAQPQFEGFTFSDDIPAALPSRLADELAIRLAPGPLTTPPVSASSID